MAFNITSRLVIYKKIVNKTIAYFDEYTNLLLLNVTLLSTVCKNVT